MTIRKPLQTRDINTLAVIGSELPLQRGRKKRGPKPIPLQDRIYKPKPAKKRNSEKRSSRLKKDVLMIYLHHKIPRKHARSRDKILGYRSPTWSEIGLHFGGPQTPIPEGTMKGWLKDIDKISNMSATQRQVTVQLVCKWPEVEEPLYKLFCEARRNKVRVRRAWFLREATAIWKKLYPNNPKLFVASIGWFRRFLSRHRITIRRPTHLVSSFKLLN
jgi:hypothetical protein